MCLQGPVVFEVASVWLPSEITCLLTYRTVHDFSMASALSVNPVTATVNHIIKGGSEKVTKALLGRIYFHSYDSPQSNFTANLHQIHQFC